MFTIACFCNYVGPAIATANPDDGEYLACPECNRRVWPPETPIPAWLAEAKLEVAE